MSKLFAQPAGRKISATIVGTLAEDLKLAPKGDVTSKGLVIKLVVSESYGGDATAPKVGDTISVLLRGDALTSEIQSAIKKMESDTVDAPLLKGAPILLESVVKTGDNDYASSWAVGAAANRKIVPNIMAGGTVVKFDNPVKGPNEPPVLTLREWENKERKYTIADATGARQEVVISAEEHRARLMTVLQTAGKGVLRGTQDKYPISAHVTGFDVDNAKVCPIKIAADVNDIPTDGIEAAVAQALKDGAAGVCFRTFLIGADGKPDFSKAPDTQNQYFRTYGEADKQNVNLMPMYDPKQNPNLGVLLEMVGSTVGVEVIPIVNYFYSHTVSDSSYDSPVKKMAEKLTKTPSPNQISLASLGFYRNAVVIRNNDPENGPTSLYRSVITDDPARPPVSRSAHLVTPGFDGGAYAAHEKAQEQPKAEQGAPAAAAEAADEKKTEVAESSVAPDMGAGADAESGLDANMFAA